MSAIVQQSASTACDTAITLGAAVTAGNALIAVFSNRFGLDVTVADNQSNTWLAPLGNFANSNGAVKILHVESAAGGSTTVTPTIGTNAGWWRLLEVSGLATSSSVEASAEGDVTDTGAPYEPGLSLSTTQPTFIVAVACDADNDARTCTGGAGDITTGVSHAAGHAFGYAAGVASGTRNAALAFDLGDTFAMQAIAFKEAGGSAVVLAGNAAAAATAAGTLTPNQIAAPIADISAGAWGPSTGASLSAALDEASADDADYISVSVANSVCEVRLASLGDPAVSSSHTLRYRLSSPVSASIRITLMQGAVQIAQWTEATTPALTTYSHTLSGAEADAITDYSNLRVRLEAL